MDWFRLKDLDARFRAFIRDTRLILPGDRLLIAHSGGSDSSFLFHMLRDHKDALQCGIASAHINHGLRGDASDADEEFVRGTCLDAGVEFFHRKVKAAELHENSGLSLEMAARKLRYEALEQIAVATVRNKVVFAHQADDRVETFLLRLVKGAGPDGLASIPLRRQMGAVELIRPLFVFKHDEIISWLDGNNVAYRTDESNLDTSIPRNAARLELLPFLESRFNPSVRDAIIRVMNSLEIDRDYFDLKVKSELETRSGDGDGGTFLNLEGMSPDDVPVIVRMLSQILTGLVGDETRPGYGHLMGAVELWFEGRRGDRIEVPDGLSIIRELKGLLIRPTPEFASPPDYEGPVIKAMGEYRMPDGFSISIMQIGLNDPENLKHPPENSVYIDEGVTGRLKVDYNRSGRRMSLLGMGGKSRKVSDILTDAGVARHRREWVPVVVAVDDMDDVLAIPHLGLISETVKVRDLSGPVLLITASPSLEDGVS